MIWSLDGECNCVELGQNGILPHVEEGRWWPTYGYSVVRRGANEWLGGDWKILFESVNVLTVVVQKSYCGLRKGSDRLMGLSQC